MDIGGFAIERDGVIWARGRTEADTWASWRKGMEDTGHIVLSVGQEAPNYTGMKYTVAQEYRLYPATEAALLTDAVTLAGGVVCTLDEEPDALRAERAAACGSSVRRG